jgi:predicted nucleotidyltransferase
MYLGLNLEQLGKLSQAIRTVKQVREAFLFGSVAKGTNKSVSEIGLAVKGRNINSNDISELGKAMEELNLPYKIEILNYDKIKDPDVTNQIDLVGIRIYKQSQEKQDSTEKRLTSKSFVETPLSNTVKKIVYSARQKVLEVELKEGGIYQYFPVPAEGWEEYKQLIEQGESAGEYYNFVVRHKYENYREVISPEQ